MARDTLKGIDDYYDAVVIGSGLGGLTGANCLAKQGHSVLLLEHHYQFGGLATWFKRAGGIYSTYPSMAFHSEWSSPAGGTGPRKSPIRSFS